jgi:DNA-binding MurR/RpiR family transcriptional regulator
LTNQKQELPVMAMFVNRSSNLYRGPSIDASYQVLVHLAEGFQRRRLKCEKLTDDGHQVMAKAHMEARTSVSLWIDFSPKTNIIIIITLLRIRKH